MIVVLTKLIKTIIMLKNILKIEGTHKLTKNEQKEINGGRVWCACNQVSLGWYSDAGTCMTACKKYVQEQ
jgi:hypothetical protein